DDLAGAAGDLTADQERDQDVGKLLKLPGAADEVVLVTAIGVARRVGVVLEDVDLACDALVGDPLLGVGHKPLDDALAGLVVGDQLPDVVTFGRGVLGVASHVEIQPGAVGEEHVGGPSPGHDLAEEVAGHLIGGEASLPVKRARDAVLVLDTEDAAIHVPTLGVQWYVEALYERARAESAAAVADFERTLAVRRDTSAQELAEQVAPAEQQLAAVQKGPAPGRQVSRSDGRTTKVQQRGTLRASSGHGR